MTEIRPILQATDRLIAARNAMAEPAMTSKMPMFFGRRDAIAKREAIVSAAIDNATEGITHLETAGAAPESIANVRSAIRLLTDTPTSTWQQKETRTLVVTHLNNVYKRELPAIREARRAEAYERLGVSVEALAADPAKMRATEHELLSHPADELTSNDWWTLGALLHADPERAVISAPRVANDAETDLATVVEYTAMHHDTRKMVPRPFYEWARAVEPEIRAQTTAEIASLAATGTAPRTVYHGEVAEIRAALPRLDDHGRISAARWLMSNDHKNATLKVRSTIEAVDAVLADVTVPEQLRPLVDETRVLTQRNLSRLAGVTPEGAVVGYATHTDYAELGEIRANLEMLEMATAKPVEATAAVATHSADTGAAAMPSDIIDW